MEVLGTRSMHAMELRIASVRPDWWFASFLWSIVGRQCAPVTAVLWCEFVSSHGVSIAILMGIVRGWIGVAFVVPSAFSADTASTKFGVSRRLRLDVQTIDGIGLSCGMSYRDGADMAAAPCSIWYSTCQSLRVCLMITSDCTQVLRKGEYISR